MRAKRQTMKSPPDGLPTYRLLTGPDDAAFCHRVSEALAVYRKPLRRENNLQTYFLRVQFFVSMRWRGKGFCVCTLAAAG